MSRTQNLRWKRKAVGLAALTVGFAGSVADGRTSTLATLCIAIGLVGAGSVAIAAARGGAGSRSRHS